MTNAPDTKKMEVVKKEVDQFLYDQQVIKIESSDDYTKAGDMLKVVKTKVEALIEKRLEYTRPLDATKKTIKADFDGITEPLLELMKKVKIEMVAWNTYEQEQLDIEQKKLEAAALVQAKKDGVLEVKVPIVNDLKTQRGAVSTTTVRKVWKFEVEDETKVPVEYMSVDEKKIKAAIADGRKKIEGVRIYQDSQISIR